MFMTLSLSIMCSCMSQEEKTKSASSEIKQDMVKQYSAKGYEVIDFNLFHKDGNEYGGTVKVKIDGEVFTYGIQATWSSSKFNWETYRK